MKTSHLSPTAWLSESLEGRTWQPLLNWYEASVSQSQMSRPRGRFAWSKARQGDSLRHQIPVPCPHSPPHGIYIDRCISTISGGLSHNLGELAYYVVMHIVSDVVLLHCICSTQQRLLPVKTAWQFRFHFLPNILHAIVLCLSCTSHQWSVPIPASPGQLY